MNWQADGLVRRSSIGCKVNRSCGARLEATYGYADIKQAVTSATGKTNKDLTEILRLRLSFKKAQLRSAQGHLKRGSRGISCSHLLTLTRVENDAERQRLMHESLEKEWSHDVLRQQITGKSKQSVDIRPKRLADSIHCQSDQLVGELDRLLADTFLDGIARVKGRDRQEACDSFEKARESLEVLANKCKAARKQFDKAVCKITENHKN